MESDPELQEHSNAIEGALCAFDNETGNQIKDKDAIKILELLLDRYYFKEEITGISDPIIERGFNLVKDVIETDLENVSEVELTKALGVIRFVARRRARGGRDYLTIIHTYVGDRVAKGIRVLGPQVFK